MEFVIVLPNITRYLNCVSHKCTRKATIRLYFYCTVAYARKLFACQPSYDLHIEICGLVFFVFFLHVHYFVSIYIQNVPLRLRLPSRMSVLDLSSLFNLIHLCIHPYIFVSCPFVVAQACTIQHYWSHYSCVELHCISSNLSLCCFPLPYTA